MSFTITTDTFCDECGWWTAGVSEGRINRKDAWLRAYVGGWRKVKGKHICPSCMIKKEIHNGKSTIRKRRNSSLASKR